MQTQSNNHNLSRLVIDNIKPKWVTCIWLFFFVLLGVLFLLVLAIPESVIRYTYNNTNSCPISGSTSKNQYCADFNITADPATSDYNPNFPVFFTGVEKKNQFFTVDIRPQVDKNYLNANTRLDMRLEFVLKVYELEADEISIKGLLYQGPQHNITITCDEDESDSSDDDSDDEGAASGVLSCNKRTILYVNQINHENYLMVVDLKNGASLKDELSTFKAYITTIDASYTDFLLALRYTCFAISILFAVYYWFALRKMRGEKLVFEQKFIRVLGILLLLFNDPIYASTILHPTLASAVFSSMFIITFVCALLLFWIAAFQRVYRESTQVKSRALSYPKLIYIFFLWLFSVVAYCILARQYLKDPSFDFNDEYEKTFTAFKVLMILMLGIGLGWMFYGFAQILRTYNTLIWRHKIFFSFSCYFILCYFVFMFTGTVNVYNLNGTKVMLLFGITNVYVWFLQVIYGPSDKGFEGSDQPISLANVFQGYEMLDENSMNRGDGGYEEEVRNPDQILFQFDNNGEVYQKPMGFNQGYGHHGQTQNQNQNQNQPATNFDNFGHQHAQVELTPQNPQYQQDESEDAKYPYELNHNDE